MQMSLSQQKCRACEGGVAALTPAEINPLREQIHAHWAMNDTHTIMHARYGFRDFHQVMAFVNAVAFIAHQENHHPDIQLSYRECQVFWTTHAAQGLTLNDFICAAKVDDLCTPLPANRS